MRPWSRAVALALYATAVHFSGVASAESREQHVSRLLADARRRIAIGTHEQRQFAMTELQEAAILDPVRTDIRLALGQMYLEADLLRNSRKTVEHLQAEDSTNAGVWLLSGRVCRRYWMIGLDDIERDRAILCYTRSTRLAPSEASGWLELAPLLTDANETQLAYAAAARGARTAPLDPKAQVLLAATAQGVGDLETASRVFESAIPHLPLDWRERYTDIRPLMPWRAAKQLAPLDSAGRALFTSDFWTGADPDPVSGENEARLEYWARVTEAIALFGLPTAGEWDARAQYYVRFGHPAFTVISSIEPNGNESHAAWLTWGYPELGLLLRVSSGSALSRHDVGISDPDMMAWADPDSLAHRRDLMGVYEGYAVFHRLPPGVEPLDPHLATAQFQSDHGTILLGHVEIAGGIEEQATAEWTVMNGALEKVAHRDQAPLSTSACRVGEASAGSFTWTLPPGRYRLGVQVRDVAGRRGTTTRDLVVRPASNQLALSDLIVICGSPSRTATAGSGVRLEPRTGLFPFEGDRLNVYLEIYRLMVPAQGGATFSYECVVSPIVRDTRGWLSRLFAAREVPPDITVSRVETTHGPTRRQFLSVPVASLPHGEYRIEVRVRDETDGAEATATTSFQR